MVHHIQHITYNYNMGGCMPMMQPMGFFMGMMSMMSAFSLFRNMGSIFGCCPSPVFNSSMYNTYAYPQPLYSDSIFSGGGGAYYSPAAASDRFVYNPNAGGGSIFPTTSTPSVLPSYSPSKVGRDRDEDNDDSHLNPNDGIVLNRRGNGYGKPFLDKVKQIAQRINCNYRDLLAVMNAESGILSHKENPDPECSATGLIQFTKQTAEQFGTSIPELIRMTPIEQLDYVEKYLVYWKKTAKLTGRLSAGDLYALVFLPGRAGNEVLCTRGEKYYSAGHNENLDYNNNGKIEKKELARRLKESYVSDRSFTG